MSKIVDATLRLVDKFTGPMRSATSALQRHSNEFIRAGRQIQRTGKNIERAGQTLTKSVTVPIAAIGTAAINTAANFEQGMSKVQSISGASEKQIDKLSEKAKEMGAKTKFSATESADAFSYMAMAGWKTKDMLNGIEGVMYLAGATGEDLATTSDIVTDSITAFGKTAKDTEHFINVMAKTANNANTNVSKLGESFKYCAPSAGALKYSIDETALALGVMANSGIKASQAGTSLNSWFTRMAKPTKESGEAMKKLGLSLTDSNGKMKPFKQVMEETRKSFSKLTTEQKEQYAAMLAGKTGMNGLLAVVNSSDKDFNKLAKAINNSSGAAKEMYEVANNNLKGRITELKGKVETLAITFGEKLLPYVEKGVDKLSKLADWFGNLTSKQQDMIIKTALAAAAVGPCIMMFGKLVSVVGGVVGHIGKLGKAIGRAGTAVRGVKTAFGAATGVLGKSGVAFKGIGKVFLAIAGPGGVVVAVITGIIAAGVLLWKNWDKVKAAGKKFGKYLKGVASDVGIDTDKMKEKFGKLGEKGKKAFGKLKEAGADIKKALGPVVKYVGAIFVKRIDLYIRQAVGFFSGFFSSIDEICGGLIDIIGGIATFISGVFTGNWKKAWSGIKDITKGIADTLVGIVKAPINGIIGAINGLIGGLNGLNIKVPKWLHKMGVKDFTFNINKLPMLYKGTNNWMGGPAMVHDKGAEIIDLPKGSRVIPHDKSLQEAAKSGTKTNVIRIEKLADKIEINKEADVDTIMDKFVDRLKDVEALMA
ncbi:MAG: phage tail tape measure protein [Lachnospiraceae bacterium]